MLDAACPSPSQGGSPVCGQLTASADGLSAWLWPAVGRRLPLMASAGGGLPRRHEAHNRLLDLVRSSTSSLSSITSCGSPVAASAASAATWLALIMSMPSTPKNHLSLAKAEGFCASPPFLCTCHVDLACCTCMYRYMYISTCTCTDQVQERQEMVLCMCGRHNVHIDNVASRSLPM